MSTRVSRGARAVVTGAGSGIGQAFAVELAARGGSVVCSDIDEHAAQRTVDAIVDQGGKALAVRCDVASLEDLQHLAHEAQSWFGNVPTLVVNNAGVGAGGAVIGETPLKDWESTIGINLWGVIHGCHVFTPILREAGYGGIINVASAASFGAAPRMAAYNVSKAGVLALSETLCAELSGTGVHVTVLCPTFVKTNILNSDRITGRSSELAATLMRLTGVSAARVARTTLNTHDRGGFYVMPQGDAKVGWAIKRHAPRTYTRGVGMLERFGPLRGSDTTHASSSVGSTEGN
ncbi:MAG: SDR family NAD(P)-dependent oxidoreductase [Actinomycetota bacterium]|nr:SDR family NAD(P)-dependent oxidoreductase [Actinomycetota bacterium]